ncbi:hypothetical protein FHS55_003137 [Angulomicrobium tetraedrale]|uniref:DNA primase/polymerase bifunctional N-terminal domain-containing protein n=1 Tax=Ancylobacter tetraedralis TaxID=217068 RepID=A0A839ZCW8_9HYPH|nr:bifunctional DNA primase/polymerase [Ancylobacter tetraedralis]MBB3772516.1 hypothetical protein [Ancylobacter tetraedralis]
MIPALSDTNPHSDVLRCRRTLWKNGFHPIPVRTGDKRPAEAKWAAREGADPPTCVAPDAVVKPGALNTGILCDGLRAIDADIDDAAISEKVWRLATAMLGEAPVRFRDDSERFLLVYRAAEGEPRKCAINGTHGAVEVLGRGNQFVAFGQHPDGAAYEWSMGSPEIRRRDQLPAVTEDQISAFFAACAPLIGARLPEAGASPSRTIGSLVAQPSMETSAWGRAALDAECERVASASPGTQSNTLASAAFKVGQRVASGEIDRADAEQSLLSAGRQMVNGDPKRRWTGREIMNVIGRQIEAGLASPVGPDRVEDDVIWDFDPSVDEKAEPAAANEPAPTAGKTPIVPVPADAPPMNFKHPAWGRAPPRMAVPR